MNAVHTGINSSETIARRMGVPVSLLWLIGFNLVGRVLWILYMHPQQQADFEWYFTHAVQFAGGHGYIDNGKPTAYWPMGWPFILSIIVKVFGPYPMPGFITNALFSTLIVVLVYALTIRILGQHMGGESVTAHRIALAGAIAYSCLPSQIEWNSVLGSEESFALLFMISFFIYAKLILRDSTEPWLWRTAASGVIFGLATIVRPIGLLFPVFLVLYELWVNRRHIWQAILRGVTFGIAMFVGISPITIRNFVAMHHFILVSTNGGVNLWQGTKINGGYYWTWNPYRNPLLKVYNNEIAKNKVGEHVAIQYILHHPFLTLKNGVIKVFDLYKVDTNAVWYTIHVQYGQSKALLYTFDIIDTLGYWLLMLGVVIAIIVLMARTRGANFVIAKALGSVVGKGNPTVEGKGSPSVEESNGAAAGGTVNAANGGVINAARRGFGLMLTFVLYNTALFFFFPAWDRFRYPLMPLFAVMFGVGWAVFVAWRQNKATGNR